jgi:hypothetical protein
MALKRSQHPVAHIKAAADNKVCQIERWAAAMRG